MRRLLVLLVFTLLLAGTADAATVVSGVGAITESVGSIDPPAAGRDRSGQHRHDS